MSRKTPPRDAGIVGILLAAGLGTRYDPTGKHLKLLQLVAEGSSAGVPVAAAAARNLRSNVAQIFSVVRPLDDPHQPALHGLLQHEGCELVVCKDADQGMGASLACGVSASANADGWIVALADMPAIDPATINAVVGALRAGHTTAAPVYRGQRGHPVGFSARCLTDLLGCQGDQGARAVLEKFAPHLIEVEDEGILIDIDHR